MDEVDGRKGNKGGQPGTSNALNMSKEGWAMRVGCYEVVRVMSTITYITIIFFCKYIYIIGLCQNFFVPSLMF